MNPTPPQSPQGESQPRVSRHQLAEIRATIQKLNAQCAELLQHCEEAEVTSNSSGKPSVETGKIDFGKGWECGHCGARNHGTGACKNCGALRR